MCGDFVEETFEKERGVGIWRTYTWAVVCVSELVVVYGMVRKEERWYGLLILRSEEEKASWLSFWLAHCT
jgi:hypothetical protein